MRQNKKLIRVSCSLAVSLVLISSSYVVFAQSSSTNYRIEESYFGTGGEVDASSANYRSHQSTGSLGVGNSSSTNYDAVSGFNTPNAPFLEVQLFGPDIDLGTLSPSAPSYGSPRGGDCNCTFTVRTYLSSEYSVFNVSQSMTSENGDVLDPKTTQGAPSGNSSVEEFGINLVANTVSGGIGANPVNVRQEGANEVQDNSFADGQAAIGYELPDQFKYGVGNIIARSQATAGNQAVGKTNYTITYMAKPSNLTPAGTYKIRHDLVVVPTF